jgi:hypothetical protein
MQEPRFRTGENPENFKFIKFDIAFDQFFIFAKRGQVS